MRLHELLSTKERIKILRTIIYEKTPVRVTRISEETRLSKGLVSKYFDMLRKEGILRRKNSEFFLQDNINTRMLKILLNLEKIDAKVFKRYGFVRGAGLYGSCAKGENTTESDTDLWVYVSCDPWKANSMTGDLAQRFGDVHALYLDDAKIAQMSRTNKQFLTSLISGSILLYGENVRFPRLHEKRTSKRDRSGHRAVSRK